MISISEAKRRMMDAVPRGQTVQLPMAELIGTVIAENIVAPIDVLPFDSSAMDGYAIRADDSGPLRVVATVAAGGVPTQAVKQGEALRIMTGAMIPEGTTAVIPQEDVIVLHDGTIRLDASVRAGAHIRRAGEDAKAGDLVIAAHTPVTPAVVAVLASCGLATAPVYARPQVAVVPTGSELLRAGMTVTPGKIFESNASALAAAFAELHVTPHCYPPVPDTEVALAQVLREALAEHDVVVVTGGVSVGECDLVKALLTRLGVQSLFWKVAQKPGKPLFCGRSQRGLVFGLPGNPAASLTCSYEYVLPAVRHWLGFDTCWPPHTRATLLEPYRKQAGRAHFVRARAVYDHGELRVHALPQQASHCLRSYVDANCLFLADAGVEEIAAGTAVDIHWLSVGGVYGG